MKRNRSLNRMVMLLGAVMLLGTTALSAQTPLWWDNPNGDYDQWHRAITTGQVENLTEMGGAQAQLVDAIVDVENEYDPDKTKLLWVQIEWSVEYVGSDAGAAQAELLLDSSPEYNIIRYLNDPSVIDQCPINPLDPMPSPYEEGTLVEDASPVSPEYLDSIIQMTTDPIFPQPSCERLFFRFLVGPDSRLTYRIEVQTICLARDFGDAPDQPYPTLANGSGVGASHVIVPGLSLGAEIDAEQDGQPSAMADGDDTNGAIPDDEDGVDVSQLILTENEPASVDVAVTAPSGRLVTVEGWIDYNGDGIWDDDETTEKAVATLTGSGTVTLDFPTVPGTAIEDTEGQTFARFRLHYDDTQLGPEGDAWNGEVEDYPVYFEEQEMDFGDAPDSYQTSLASDGARHVIMEGLSLGTEIDAEVDGVPSVGADSDDLDVSPDDEDGVVTLPLQFTAGDPATVELTVNTPDPSDEVTVTGWIDFDGNGTFDPAEQALATRTGGGSVTLDFGTVPASATTDTEGETYARFRLALGSDPVDPFGEIMNGEVEDYPVMLDEQEWDFGDAPDSYQTRLASNGARHRIIESFFMGSLVDPETDGVPSVNADSDDMNMPTNDEDGINSLPLQFNEGDPVSLVIDVTTPLPSDIATVTGWIDYDGNGTFDPQEQASATRTGSGQVTLDFLAVPGDAYENTGGATYARFRLHLGDQPATPSGAFENGEVEDYPVTLNDLPDEYDFGDAPEGSYNFPTTLARDGARHIIVDGLYLGSQIDSENDGHPINTALGDDQDNIDDEDGVIFPSAPLVQGETVTIEVIASAQGILNAWMDLNGNGSWDGDNEHIFQDETLVAGSNSLAFTVPSGDPTNVTAYSRFRFTSPNETGIDSAGLAVSGEVEDYLVNVLFPIELSAFTASVQSDGIQLEWVTQSETENLGFRIYRSESEEGPYTEITQNLIPGAGSSQSVNRYSYLDDTADEGKTYFYKLGDVTYNGQIHMNGPVRAQSTPADYTLYQNYPNPFNPETQISFSLKQPGQVELAVYNLRGQQVRRLASEFYNAGTHTVTWDGKNSQGSVMPTGVYLYKIKVNDFEQSKRMEFLK